jgi:hypothetical protein
LPELTMSTTCMEASTMAPDRVVLWLDFSTSSSDAAEVLGLIGRGRVSSVAPTSEEPPWI